MHFVWGHLNKKGKNIMELIGRTKIVDVLQSTAYGTTVNVKGWVRTRRGSKQVSFIALNDGSTINNVQIVVDVEKFGEEYLKPITTGLWRFRQRKSRYTERQTRLCIRCKRKDTPWNSFER